MILKNCLTIITLLLGFVMTKVTPYSEYKDEVGSGHINNSQNKSNGNLNLALMQLEADDNQRKLSESINNVGINNISENQLLNEYISIEHNDNQDYVKRQDKITSTRSAEQNLKDSSKEWDYETEIDLNKSNRTSRVIISTITTPIPEYIRRSDGDKLISVQRDINVSSPDYVGHEIMDHVQKQANEMFFNENVDNSSEENEEIVPLAIKFYDEIAPENSFVGRHIEEVNSEDYYEDEYQQPQSTTSEPLDNSILHHLLSSNNADITTTTTTYIPSPLTTTIVEKDELPVQTTLSSLQPLQPLPPPQPQIQSIFGTTTTRIISTDANAIPDKKAKHITIKNTAPIATTTAIISSRRRLLPHEKLRSYIEDAYIRMPLAVIVDPSAESLEKTKTLWNEAMHTNFNIKIVLVTLNESHESPAAFNFNNTRQFLNGLNSIKEQKSGDAFRGVSHAAELVPYDSAVFISTAELEKLTDRVKDSAITLLKKRIRLYLIWFGEHSSSENETQDSVGGILGEVALRSGGDILHGASFSENSQEFEGSTLTIVADALRGSHEIDVPVDTTLSSLHVKIDKLMRRAILETPNGEINLKKQVRFKSEARTTVDDDVKHLDAYVPLTKLRKQTVYKLKLRPEDLATEYSVFIRSERKADTLLDDMIKHFETYFMEGHTSYSGRARGMKLQQMIKNSNNYPGLSTHSKIQFPIDNNDFLPKTEVETISNGEIHSNTIKNNTSALALSTAQNRNSIFPITNTKIEMGIHSQLLIAPGVMAQLYFEVTNTGYEINNYNIQVVDEKRYLIRLTPQSLFLKPGEMAVATVSVFAPENTEANVIDHITFSTTISGTAAASLTVNLKVITTVDAQDNTPPSISWTFGSRCEGVSNEFNFCSERFWNMYIVAQDWQTGILRLQAIPSSGLLYTKPYTIGTTEPLATTYVASCCETKVSLVAFDGAGNQRSYNIDVRDIVLTEASIAAIVLGTILLILLIVLLIAAAIWCCRKRKIVLDLPTYRSHSTRSME